MSTHPRASLSPRLGLQRGFSRPRTHPRKVLWILVGILLIAGLFLAGPAHQVLHHGSDGAGGCTLCHVSMPEAPRFEPLVLWLAVQAVALAPLADCVQEHALPEQGNARAPPGQV